MFLKLWYHQNLLYIHLTFFQQYWINNITKNLNQIQKSVWTQKEKGRTESHNILYCEHVSHVHSALEGKKV